MSKRTADRPEEVPIATQTRVPRDPPQDDSDEKETVEEPDEAPIATATRVAP